MDKPTCYDYGEHWLVNSKSYAIEIPKWCGEKVKDAVMDGLVSASLMKPINYQTEGEERPTDAGRNRVARGE